MTKEDVWNLFKMTGNVKYYLKYKLITIKNAHVKLVQERLNYYGAKLTVDSSYGPKTRDAVKAFQKANSIVL